jgi:drug/metabolite transporter (DMT)-like permease
VKTQSEVSSTAVPRRALGIALALATAVAFAFNNASARLALEGGSTPLTLAAFRFILPTLALIVWLRLRGLPLGLPARDRWIAMALGVVTALYTWSLLTAIGRIPLAMAILVFYLFPLVATLILTACGWEKFGWRTLLTIVLAFAGLALALDPRAGNLDVVGIGLAFVGALGLGTVIALSSRVIRAGDSRPVTLHIAAVAGTLLIALCLAQGAFALPVTGRGWLGFVGTAGFYAFAMIAFFIALSLIGPLRVSLLSYAEPVIAAGLGVILLGEALLPVQMVGIALVVAALVGATRGKPAAPERP